MWQLFWTQIYFLNVFFVVKENLILKLRYANLESHRQFYNLKPNTDCTSSLCFQIANLTPNIAGQEGFWKGFGLWSSSWMCCCADGGRTRRGRPWWADKTHIKITHSLAFLCIEANSLAYLYISTVLVHSLTSSVIINYWWLLKKKQMWSYY